jgi:hypothetical protein
MTSDTPQGDPRLQRTSPGPQVATGYVDPCIVYLETTLPGEIPLVVACWGKSSQEIREPDGKLHWELENVLVVKCLYRHGYFNGKLGWRFTTHHKDRVILKNLAATDRTIVFSDYTGIFEDIPPAIFQRAIRFLDRETDALLRKKLPGQLNNPNALACELLQQSKLDWPSISGALASFALSAPRPRRPSVLRSLIASVFAKKPKPAPA